MRPLPVIEQHEEVISHLLLGFFLRNSVLKDLEIQKTKATVLPKSNLTFSAVPVVILGAL
jgi:hypothetical protein